MISGTDFASFSAHFNSPVGCGRNEEKFGESKNNGYLAIENKAKDLFTNHFIHCESTKNELPIGTPLLF